MSKQLLAFILLFSLIGSIYSVAAAEQYKHSVFPFIVAQESGDKTLLSNDQPLPVNARILSLLALSESSPEQAREIQPKIIAISDNFNRAERYLMSIINALLLTDDSRLEHHVNELLSAIAMEDRMAKSQLVTPDFAKIHLILAELYVKASDYDKAYQQKEIYIEKYQDYRDQLREQRLTKLNKKYETDLKVKANELLKSQHELKALQLKETEKSTQIQQRNSLIFIITAIVFLVLLIRQFRVRSILRSLSNTDSLTGLYNRRTLFEQGEHFVKQYADEGKTLSVIMLDIDYFKQVNDDYGHDKGDQVINKVATLGRETIRTRDVFARLGGEEFAVVLPATQLEEAKAIAERFREKVEQVYMPDIEQMVTISAGVANIVDTAANFDDLLHAADQAMYQAKAAGRNQVCCYQG
ncbi:hypothetical protein tinsulaeT_29250 [Thalassotalea insulae]|uniref:diguanylate cyclase n=1 Tax=Thalassotalea insulae TaxID=2056778 RepID=A0ABQ6GYJ6_9GAMM|nr:GGDEF domain-containing protein [Thalassotalea insulae]GLX79585.1 hypothetical protein tinsulaeT_29250 [Thalassotalea insulae]